MFHVWIPYDKAFLLVPHLKGLQNGSAPQDHFKNFNLLHLPALEAFVFQEHNLFMKCV